MPILPTAVIVRDRSLCATRAGSIFYAAALHPQVYGINWWALHQLDSARDVEGRSAGDSTVQERGGTADSGYGLKQA